MSADPVLIAYTAKRSKPGKPGKPGKPAIWTRIGRAYPHDVGAGLTVVLDSIPLDGRVILLELDEADDRQLIKETDLRRSERGTGET